MIPLPYKLLGLIFTCLAFAFGGFWYGQHTEDLEWQAKARKAEREAHDQYVSLGHRFNEVSQALEIAKNEKQIVYQTIMRTVDRIVDRPVYRNVCLDDSGLHAINAAAAGKTANSGESPATLPATDAP